MCAFATAVVFGSSSSLSSWKATLIGSMVVWGSNFDANSPCTQRKRVLANTSHRHSWETAPLDPSSFLIWKPVYEHPTLIRLLPHIRHIPALAFWRLHAKDERFPTKRVWGCVKSEQVAAKTLLIADSLRPKHCGASHQINGTK